MNIKIKTLEEQNKMRSAGKLLSKILSELISKVNEGVTTKILDSLAYDLICSFKAKPSFLGYYGFPASICTSVNDEIVHGIPSNRVLKSGDLLSLDIGIFYDGYCSDTAVTLPIGEVSDIDSKLIYITEKSLYNAIEQCYPGNKLGDIGYAVQSTVEKEGFSIVRDYVGHGIGVSLHEDPQVFNYGEKGKGLELKEGMVLAIEPMVNIGTFKTKVMKDNWTVVTKDGRKSAHFEHTVLITQNGHEILTRR